MKKPTSKAGRRLANEIKRYGLEMVLNSFRWLAYGQTWHAKKQRSRATINMMSPLRHVEDWSEHWERNGERPDEPATTTATTPTAMQSFSERFAAQEDGDDDLFRLEIR